MYPHTHTQLCVHVCNTCCATRALCPRGFGGCTDLAGCVCVYVRPLTRTQALEQPTLQFWISPCTLRSVGVLWKEWALLTVRAPQRSLSVATHSLVRYRRFLLPVLTPHQCICRDRLSPSFNKRRERHPGLGHVTVPCPPCVPNELCRCSSNTPETNGLWMAGRQRCPAPRGH